MITAMEPLCREHDILFCQDGVVRVPFLVKGELLLPPMVEKRAIEAAFSNLGDEITYAKLPNAQALRETVIDRNTMKPTSEYIYQLLPVIDPHKLIETDIEKLAREPYSLSLGDILSYLKLISDRLSQNQETVKRVQEISRKTSEHPDLFLDGAFTAMLAGLDPQPVQDMIDHELSIWGIPGRRFLEGWVEITSDVITGLVPLIAQVGLGSQAVEPDATQKTKIRAMPTRQLHITAGNAPQIPLISALRIIMTKSAGVIKSPYGATLPGALFSLAAYRAAPDHPFTRNLSMVYWQGGDENVELPLFAPGAFDRIVVWGSPDAVTSVQSKAIFTKVISFNPRFGISMIGQSAFSHDLDRVVFSAAMDSMIYNQKSCSASLVHYVEGSENQIEEYGQSLREVLKKWDQLAPQFISPSTRGQLKRLRRGKYFRAKWLTNTVDDEFTSGVVIMPDEFDIMDHPMCRLVVIRRVDSLRDVFKYLHHGISTVGVYPEERRQELLDHIASRGVSNILPLGHCERVFPGAPHDGMMVLNQLVDWKNG
jgi:hypothetical protein